jgi:hypothetical protein
LPPSRVCSSASSSRCARSRRAAAFSIPDRSPAAVRAHAPWAARAARTAASAASGSPAGMVSSSSSVAGSTTSRWAERGAVSVSMARNLPPAPAATPLARREAGTPALRFLRARPAGCRPATWSAGKGEQFAQSVEYQRTLARGHRPPDPSGRRVPVRYPASAASGPVARTRPRLCRGFRPMTRTLYARTCALSSLRCAHALDQGTAPTLTAGRSRSRLTRIPSSSRRRSSSPRR